MSTNNESNDVFELSAKDGEAFIEQSSPLTRLHYFDGKFLRADAFALEQDYHRARVRLSNLAGGWGVVNGLGIGLDGDQLKVSGGLAITAAGNFVLATGAFAAKLADLLAVAKPAPLSGNSAFGDCADTAKPAAKESSGLTIYEITVGPVEGLCGNEPVYGKLCESACVGSSQHPYWREGVVLRLRPINLVLPTSSAVILADKHLRNRIASAYFAAEPWLTANSLSAAGLASDLWCNPAQLYGRDEVVIGLLARDNGVNRVIDAWSGRRERMDTQARGYWQGRMAMRPWNVFIAQILQFQCQLAGLFAGTGGVVQPPDDCDNLRELLEKTRREIELLHSRYTDSTRKILRQFGEKATKKDAQAIANQVKLSYAELYDISNRLNAVNLGKGVLVNKRLLINAGFMELPPAGYLPVTAGKDNVQPQLERFFGEGVRLHCYAVRHDEIAHLVEEAQHMERISLTRGLDDSTRIEDVEIFVPDGETFGVEQLAPGEWWQVDMAFAALSSLDLALRMTPEEAGKTANDAAVALKQARTGKTKAAMLKSASLTAGQIEEIKQQLAALMRTIFTRSFKGLARTLKDENGSYGLTLVATLDNDDIIEAVRKLIEIYPEIDAKGALSKQLDAFSGLSLYLAGDSTADPVTLPLGQRVNLSGELAITNQAISIYGALTGLQDRTLTNGLTERIAQLELVVTQASGTSVGSRGEVSMIRQGNGQDGQFRLDDARHDPASSPNLFEWQSSPRRAFMYVEEDAGKLSIVKRMMSKIVMRDSADAEVAEVAGANKAAVAEKVNPIMVEATTRKEMVRLDGLAAMPGIDSAIGAAAMNALVRLAEASKDPSLLARARRRLFPTLDAPVTAGVRAVLDWVMFRRARTLLCCPPVPTVPARPAVETFQAWHLQVADAEALKTLQSALDQNDETQLATYTFRRVGVLRYRDENTLAEEPESQVENMWSQVSPGPRVVLGRYWEQAPVAGHGWQNHVRLTALLDQIKEITTPPASGSGAISVLTPVPAVLSDRAMDGGMLVVTMAAPPKNELLYVFERDRGIEVRLHTKLLIRGTEPDSAALEDFTKLLAQYVRMRDGSVRIRYIWVAGKETPDADALNRGQSLRAKLKEAGLPVIDAPGIVQVATLSPDHQNGIRERLKAESADILADVDEVVLIELLPSVDLHAPILVKVEDATSTNSSLRLTVTISNDGDNAVRLGEYATGSARFLDESVVADIPDYPEDIIATNGLTVSDNSPLAPGETRTVELTITGTNWNVPDPSYAGHLYIYDAAGNRYTVAVAPLPGN